MCCVVSCRVASCRVVSRRVVSCCGVSYRGFSARFHKIFAPPHLTAGSFYVWSMLLPALEESLGVSRTSLSLVNSIANICFTLGTTHFAPRLFASRRLSIAGVALVW